MGENTKYDGGNNEQAGIKELLEFYELVPFCPEVEAGLPTPRLRCEIYKGVVFNEKREDLSAIFNKGAAKALQLCKLLGIRTAILKENSPSCGTHKVYNGNFEGVLVSGMGKTAELLSSQGIRVLNEEEGLALLEKEKAHKALKEEKVAAAIAKAAESAHPTGSDNMNEPEEEEAPRFSRGNYGNRRPRFGEGENLPEGEQAAAGEAQERKPYGDRRSYGDRKPYRGGYPRRDYGERKPFFKKDGANEGASPESASGEEGFKKPYRERRPYGDKRSYGDKKSFGGKRSYGERPSYGSRKPYGEKRDYGDRKPYGEKKAYGERRSYGDKKPFGGNKTYGDRKSYGDKKPYGEKRAYGDRKPYGEKRSYGSKKPYGERRSYGDKKPFVKKESKDKE